MATAGRRSRRASGWPHPQAEGVRVRDSSRRVGLSPSSQLGGCGVAAAWRRWCRLQPTAYCSIDSQKLLVVHTYLLVAHFRDYSRIIKVKVRGKGRSELQCCQRQDHDPGPLGSTTSAMSGLRHPSPDGSDQGWLALMTEARSLEVGQPRLPPQGRVLELGGDIWKKKGPR